MRLRDQHSLSEEGKMPWLIRRGILWRRRSSIRIQVPQ